MESLEKEKSHFVELVLEDQPGVLSLHVSITALCNQNSTSDIKTNLDDSDRLKEIESEFSLLKTTKAMSQIGWLQVSIFFCIT